MAGKRKENQNKRQSSDLADVFLSEKGKSENNKSKKQKRIYYLYQKFEFAMVLNTEHSLFSRKNRPIVLYFLFFLGTTMLQPLKQLQQLLRIRRSGFASRRTRTSPLILFLRTLFLTSRSCVCEKTFYICAFHAVS